jgi:hypothetical protein
MPQHPRAAPRAADPAPARQSPAPSPRHRGSRGSQVSSSLLTPSKPPQPAPEWRVGGRSGPTIPPAEAGCTRRAATKWRTRASPGLRHAAAGSQGSDAHPPDRVPEAKRRDAQRRVRSHQRASAAQLQRSCTRAALSYPAGRRGGVRALVRAPAAAAPSGRIERATRKSTAPRPLAPPQERASVRSPDPRVPCPGVSRPRQRSRSERTETPPGDSASRSGVERGHAAGVRRPDTTSS